jgi:thymidylate kinase
MPKGLVVFEGYDGAGKTSLIEAVRGLLSGQNVRIIGRKNEPELRDISRAVERVELPPHVDVELLLRISLEIERTYIVDREIAVGNLAFYDRGLISLRSWFDYHEVRSDDYEPLLRRLLDFHRDSITVVCKADFETCWSRISEKPEKSWKERQGVDDNRRYFSMYEGNIRRYAAESEMLVIDTVGLSIAQSAAEVVRFLASRRLCA